MNCTNLAILTQYDWICKEAKNKKMITEFPEPQRMRITGLPASLTNLIMSYDLLANKNDTVWFITYELLLAEQDENSFSWNEFEKESLNAAISQNDMAKVSEFWSNHFCFIMSVKSGYIHISIVTKGENKGQIVWGEEPQYEDINVLAKTYDEFFSILTKHISGVKKNEILNIIL